MKVIILVSLCIFINCSRLFLMGGAVAANNTELYNALAQASGRVPAPNKCNENWSTTTCPRIAVVTSAAADQATGNSAFSQDLPNSPSYYTLFKTYGFTAKHVSAHIDNYVVATDPSKPAGSTNQDILLSADVIFFNGGDQARHSRTWLYDNGTCNYILCQVIQKFNANQVVITGTSAGLNIQANPTFGEGSSLGQIYFTNLVGLAPKSVKDGAVNGTGLRDTRNGTSSSSLQYSENGGKMPGFGLSNGWLVDSHFDARGRLVRLVPAMKDMNIKYGVGIDQDTAVYFNNDEIAVYGSNGAFAVDLTGVIYTTGQYFKASNIRINYLTSGDRMNKTTFSLKSSKPLITTPYYSNHTDSTDLTAAYESTLLITRLVDQKESYNLGKTKASSAFPKNTPTFQIKYSKDEKTKGYYSNKKYSAQNVILEYSYLSNNLIVEE